jgi:peptidoglycan/LPS O-acetylase OafA/YrhL
LIIACGCIFRDTFSYLQFVLPIGLYWALRRIKRINGLEFLGRKSGAIYVWHDPLLLPACSIIAVKLISNDIIEVVVILGLSIVISILMGEIANRTPNLSFYRF